MQTLALAIERRLQEAALSGLIPGSRKQIEVRHGRAWLRLSWVTEAGQAMLHDDDATDVIHGAKMTVFSAINDTVDEIAVPAASEIKEAAAALGCRWVDRGDPVDENYVVYWLR